MLRKTPENWAYELESYKKGSTRMSMVMYAIFLPRPKSAAVSGGSELTRSAPAYN